MFGDAFRNRFEISPQRYAQVTAVALVGPGADRPHRRRGAADRLRASAAPTGPSATGGTTPPLESHAVIEYGQPDPDRLRRRRRDRRRVLAFFRRPYRWHLALFGALLPLGVIGQAILGALVVKYHLAPGTGDVATSSSR